MIRRPWGWPALFGVLGALIVALHLVGLQASPPGLYQDEAAIGYDAWAIAHHGVDQHGAAFPLFFESFGDYKSPLYFYLLAPLTWVLPVTPYVVRLPAALCGLTVCALVALTAHQISGSPRVALLALGTAGFMPWLVLESRVGFEVVTLTLVLTAALWCLARTGRVWFLAAGVCLAAGIFAYPTGRLLVGLLLPGLVMACRSPRPRGWWLTLAAPGTGYAALGAWWLSHPGALTARFNALSIFADHPGPLVAAARFLGNYTGYFDFPFLWLRGDANPRHATGLGGMLLLAVAPAVVAGVVACWRRRGEFLPALALYGLLVAPLPAALTGEGSPHALRAAPMLPFLLLVASYGWAAMAGWLGHPSRRRTALAVVAGLQVTVYLLDLGITYPGRAESSFNAGVPDAISAARSLAGEHRVLLSSNLGQPYAHALFRLLPAPRGDLEATLAAIRVRQGSPEELGGGAHSGDVLVFSPRDRRPPCSRPVREERITAAWGTTETAAVLYRVDGDCAAGGV